MANPITWRNVGSTVRAGAAGGMMRGAQDSLNSGFDSLRGVLDEARETQEHNHAQLRDNNTQDFLNRLARIRTPEALEAARQGGGLMDQLQGYGAAIDREAARTSLDERLGVLQDRQTATDQYTDAQTMRDNRGLRAEMSNLMLSGRADEAQQLYEANADRFVDAAGVRRGMFDDRTALTAENRAVRTDARAGARLSMAQERQSWARDEQRRIQEEQNQTDLWQSLTDEAYARRTGDNAPDASQEQLNAQLHQRLRDAGATVTEADQQIASLDQALINRVTPSALSQAEDDRADAIARETFNIDGNPWAESPSNPAEVVQNLSGSHQDSEGRFLGISDADDRRNALGTISRLASEGVAITAPDGRTTRSVPVPEGVLDIALKSVRGHGLWNLDNDLEDTVRRLMLDGGMEQQYNNFQDYQDWQEERRQGRASRLPPGPGRLNYDQLRNAE